ncbi:MAG: response regulator, partial [Rhodospirillaceae bacterium]|nr:response regulator [Rhodospirillaceae bacterium]
MGSVANDTRDVMTVKRAKILVVDDDEDIISFLKITLEAEGHIVHTALSAEEGLESVNQDCPDLILLDLMMPDKDGGWFFDEFKSRHPNLINTPICFLTAKSDREDIIKGIRQGVDAYLTKPIDPELLLATIDARLKHAEEIRNPPAAGKTSPLTVVVAALLTAVAFILDLIAPLGVAGGMPYVLLVLSGWWFRDRSSVLYLATIGSVLTFLGYYISPLGSSGGLVLTNRAYAVVIIWAVAFFIWWTWRNRHTDFDPSIAAHKPGQLGTSLFTKESIFVSVLAILIALSSWGILSRIQEGAQRDVAKSLRTALEPSHLSIRRHMDDQKKTAIVWASNKLIQREIADLISLPTNAEVLINSRAQNNLRESITPVFRNTGYRGFFVISNNNINLASTRDGNIGVVNLLSTQGDYLERVRAGETLISLPQHSDVPLTDVSGEMVEKLATMFVATPIMND